MNWICFLAAMAAGGSGAYMGEMILAGISFFIAGWFFCGTLRAVDA